jgi:hypothetical protein
LFSHRGSEKNDRKVPTLVPEDPGWGKPNRRSNHPYGIGHLNRPGMGPMSCNERSTALLCFVGQRGRRHSLTHCSRSVAGRSDSCRPSLTPDVNTREKMRIGRGRRDPPSWEVYYCFPHCGVQPVDVNYTFKLQNLQYHTATVVLSEEWKQSIKRSNSAGVSPVLQHKTNSLRSGRPFYYFLTFEFDCQPASGHPLRDSCAHLQALYRKIIPGSAV